MRRFALAAAVSLSPPALTAGLDIPQGPAWESLAAASGALAYRSPEALKAWAGHAFGEGVAAGPAARTRAVTRVARVGMTRGIATLDPAPPGPKRPPIEYVTPKRVRAVARVGGLLGAVAGFLALGFLGAVAGVLAGYTAGAFLGQKVPKPAVGLAAGAAAAVGLGLGAGGLILGGAVGWLIGLTLTLFS